MPSLKEDEPKVCRNSSKQCNNEVDYRPQPKLNFVVSENTFRRRNVIKYKWNYPHHVVILIGEDPVCNVFKSDEDKGTYSKNSCPKRALVT